MYDVTLMCNATHYFDFNAPGKEPFYEQFGFSKRPNDYTGYGMGQWITK
jgi:hypothetical protein